MTSKKEKERSPNWGGSRPGAGRPPKQEGRLRHLVQTSLNDELLAKLDEYMEETESSTRAEALRRLIDHAHEA